MKVLLTIGLLLSYVGVLGAQSSMALVKGGDFSPLYGSVSGEPVFVDDFLMDVTPVTYADFEEFVGKNPDWQRSKVKKLFVDERYLANWPSDTQAPEDLKNRPITQVSWYAAKAYCECQDKRLPTLDEWEYAAMASATQPDARRDSLYNVSILRGYEQPRTYLNPVGLSDKNYWGIQDLHGLVWEWTYDFNGVILTGESRNNGNTDRGMFCASGAIGASDLMNYAAFMRYAMRSSVKARYNITTMGFRCVKDYQQMADNQP